MNESIRSVAIASAVTVGAVLTGFGGVAINDVVTNPEHSKDIADLTEYTSPEGNQARCATTLSLDFQRSLHEATNGEMSDEDAELFAPVLADLGVENIDGEPLEAQDLKDITAADLSKVPGFDCDEKEGASTFVVIESVKKNILPVLGGMGLMLGAAAFGLGVRSGRKSEQKKVK